MSLSFRHSIVSALVLLGMGTPALPQAKAKAASAAPATTAAPLTAEHLKGLEFRSIGPAIMGGRIDDFAVVEADPKTFYVGTASGGILKTTNNGTTFEPVFDDQLVSSIGDLAIAPSDPQVLYAGTGEPNNRQSSSWGNGVYKTLDGGKTWQHMGLAETHHIGRVLVHPTRADVVYVAALGRLWGPSQERGLYKTTDGGRTWTNTKFVDPDTGFVDVAMDPQSPDTLYAASYQRRRTPFGYNGGGPGSGLWKTTDGGATWTKLTKGLPEGEIGRIGLAVYLRDPRIVYALFEHAKEGGIYRSEDRGETWSKMSATNPRPSYYSKLRIDPNNDQRIWVLGAPMYTSEDGGKTFKTDVVDKIHGDYHAMWIDPRELGPHARGQRRRHPPELRPRPQLGLRQHVPARAALRGGARQPAPVPRLRRAAGQRQLVGALAHPLPAGDLERRVDPGRGRRRLLLRARPDRSQTSSTPRARTAASSACTARPASAASSARSRPRARSTASTGTRRSWSRPTTRRRSTTAATSCSARATAATPGRSSRPTSPRATT